MSWYPGAKKRPVSGHTDGPMRSYRGVVLHVNESNGNLYNWVAGDHNMSCHFEVYKDGSVEQYIDTKDTSWCQMDGNADWLSVETEGYHTEPLTDAQVQTIAGIVKWMHDEHGIALQIANSPNDHGFGWHGMGGAAWGGHTDCPGDKRKAQRQQILDIAQGDDDMALTQNQLNDIAHAVWAFDNNGNNHAWGLLNVAANPAAFAKALVAALPSDAKGGLTEAQVEDAVKKVFADAGS